ncbi:hypothetical protein [Pseudanabaena sp. FACHB-2040]|uniref:hypothetical protein n=1 Tax=Pseudanabaena sp. FACHB-2040 TaxID=2692859 RepID=UPI001686CAD3|nr:hypothetical protein [Pseudanabaena sp. FACHB-2040]MBD2256727.1 hypothetical protein [Pseudanabaena sp. FACHB-2040]
MFYQVASQWSEIQPNQLDCSQYLPVTLHLRRQPFPLEYVSPLPLQLAAILKQPIQEMTSLVIEGVIEGLQGESVLGSDTPSSLELSIMQRITLLPSASGQLGLQLDRAALMLWLNLLVALPWPETQAAYPPAQVSAVGLSPLSERLHLSPLALIQHTHARCLGLATELPSSSASLTETKAAPTPETESSATATVIWALADLVDALAAAGESVALLQRGCFLSEAVYEWLKPFYQERTANPALASLILQAVQQTLQHLLQQLGHSAPGAV